MTAFFRRLLRQAPITFLFCASLVVVYLLTAVGSHSLENNLHNSSIARAWTLYLPEMGLSGVGPLRAVGAIFLHQGPSHLALNVLLIFLVGREVERAVGRWLYVMALAGGGLGSSAAVVWMNPMTPTVGASGVGYALMAMLVVLSRRRGVNIAAPLALLAVNLGYSLITPNVSLWAHLGGLVAGLLIAWGLFARALRKIMGLVMTAVVVAAVVLICLRVNQFSTGDLWTPPHLV